MAMVGAAVGGGGSLLSGKSLGKSLKNAALGATLGYGGGTLLGTGAAAGAGGAATGATGAAGTGLSQGASGLLGVAPTATTTASLAPTIAQSAVPEALAGTIESSGMVFNPVTGSYLAPEAYLGASSATPIYTGTGSLLDKFTMGAQSLGSDLSARLPDAMSIDNLKGAAMVANQFQPQPMQAAPAGRIEVGQAPSPEGFAQFMQQYYPQYKRQRSDLGVG
jgi:hypothetical protein